VTTLRFVQDDNNHVVTLTVAADGTPVDLTGATVEFLMVVDSTLQTVTGTPDPDQTTNPGVVSFTFTSTHLANDGKGKGEVQVTSGSDVWTYPTNEAIEVIVRKDLS
jgi:hypothetical protein